MIHHYSASSVSTFLECPLKFYYMYYEKKRIPKTPPLVMGSSFHEAAHANFEQKIKSYKDLKLSVVEDHFNEAFKMDSKDVLWSGLKPDNVKNKGLDCVRKFHSERAPQIQPTISEHKFSVPMKDISLPLLGYIDIEDKNGVADFKVTSQSWSQAKVDKDLQLTFYSFARSKENNKFSPRVRIEAIQHFKTQEPVVHVLSSSRTLEHFAQLKRILLAMEKMLKAGIFYPALDSWGFKCDYCDFKVACSQWR